MGAAILMGIVGAVVVVVWRKAKKSPDWRKRSMPYGVCQGHGGDAMDKCSTCRQVFCRECDPDGHCIPQYEPRGPWQP